MLTVAIIGCGNIADQHAAIISNSKRGRLIAVCDREPLMAMQLADRFGIGHRFDNADEMLSVVRPDIVHITSHPLSHFELGRRCLDAGCHIYVEKPFTQTTEEARILINLAESKGLQLTVGHNLQFSHASRRMRRLVHNGFLGGNPVHMESYYCYNLSDPKYAAALLGDKNHWIRKLPGKLLHNVISHGISKIAEFIHDEDPSILAYGQTSPLLQSIGEDEIIDEIRVIISSASGTTAYFTCSTQMRPPLRHFRIFGPQNGIEIDEDNQSLNKIWGRHLKSYLNQFLPPFIVSAQRMKDFSYNVYHFLINDFHVDSGMRYLINAFYESITYNHSPPIPYKEILLTSDIMEKIFNNISILD